MPGSNVTGAALRRPPGAVSAAGLSAARPGRRGRESPPVDASVPRGACSSSPTRLQLLLRVVEAWMLCARFVIAVSSEEMRVSVCSRRAASRSRSPRGPHRRRRAARARADTTRERGVAREGDPRIFMISRTRTNSESCERYSSPCSPRTLISPTLRNKAPRPGRWTPGYAGNPSGRPGRR